MISDTALINNIPMGFAGLGQKDSDRNTCYRSTYLVYPPQLAAFHGIGSLLHGYAAGMSAQIRKYTFRNSEDI